MRCDVCLRRMNYGYRIDDQDWMKATGGVQEGHLCAHCVLDRIGGEDWSIVFNEAASTMANAEHSHLPRGRYLRAGMTTEVSREHGEEGRL